MERKIGEIFEHNGEWHQCVKSQDGSCKHCDMNFEGKCPIPIKECTESGRSDKSYVIFKKLEKVGEPKMINGRMVQKVKQFKANGCVGCCLLNNGICLKKYADCHMEEIYVEIKQNKEDMEEKKLNLKPFDLEAAKAGKTVCTRDGRKVRIICFDAKRKDENSIIALVPSKDYPGFEDLIAYPNNGNYYGGHENDGDLMMLPEKKEGWVNIVRGNDGRSYMGRGIFQSKEEAENTIKAFSDNLTDTIKICWEE